MELAANVSRRAPAAIRSAIRPVRSVARAVPSSMNSMRTTVGRAAAKSLPQATGHPARGTLFRTHSDSPSRPKDCAAIFPLNMIV